MDGTYDEVCSEKESRMVANIQIDSIEKLNDLLWDQREYGGIERHRSHYLYRGLPNENFHLVTSLRRNCKQKKENLELPILRNFTKYAELEDSALKTSVWRQMIVGQHHGLPTRLLDWTYSPLAALHFATSGEALSEMKTSNCVLWKIDIDEINTLLPENYRDMLSKESAHLMTTDMLDELLKETDALERYDSDMDSKAMVLLEPPSIDQRIINQYSYFSVIPAGMENNDDDFGIEQFLENYTYNTAKYIINRELKWRIRDMLDHMNMNERIVFPGLDGLSKWLTRHYYVM